MSLVRGDRPETRGVAGRIRYIFRGFSSSQIIPPKTPGGSPLGLSGGIEGVNAEAKAVPGRRATLPLAQESTGPL
jgi:hypothetical protein